MLGTLIHDPELVILDEPFSGLDPVNAELMRDVILQMKAQNRTVIFSTHVMEQAEQICDFIFLINKGRKVIDGQLAEVRGSGDRAIRLDYDGDGRVLRELEGVRRINDAGKTAEIFLEPGRDPQDVLKSLVGRIEVRASTCATPRCTRSSCAPSEARAMNKVALVAAREYVENLRTKTFWVGILSVPFMLLIFATIPRLLERAKDVRRYAVVDNSGWLLEAIEERANYDDTLQILRYLREEARPGTKVHRDLPRVLSDLERMVRGVKEGELAAFARSLALQQRSMLASGDSKDMAGTVTDEMQTEYTLWLLSLSPERAKAFGGVARKRYERVEVPADGEDPEQALRGELDAGRLFAYFVIGPNPLDDSRDGHKYVSNNRTDDDLKKWVSRLASAEVEARRFEREGIDPEVARRIQAPLDFAEKQVSATGEESEVEDKDFARQYAPIAFVYMLWIAIMTIAQLLLTNTIEEKSNRIVEVLLSSITAMELMVGKILGIAATGLTTVAAWVACILVFLKYLPRLMMDAPADFDLSLLVSDPIFLSSFVAYFLLGFLLYASILVGIGSACNSIKEAQNLMAPIMILLMLPLLAMFPVSQDPNGTLAVVLSFIPPFTPFVMMNRAAGPPETWEYLVTGVLLLASIGVAFWAASRIFRVGILMTGKPPRISEIWRWVFKSAG